MAEAATNPDFEIWRDVIGWESDYEVSSHGRVRRKCGYYMAKRQGVEKRIPIQPRILKPGMSAKYPMVELCRGGVCKKHFVHSLVCEAFHGPRNGRHVAHGDGTKTNNRADNLRWATPSENMRDKVLHGTQKRGDQLWFTKVSDQMVEQIRQDRGRSNKSWSDELGVSSSVISRIRSGSYRASANGELV